MDGRTDEDARTKVMTLLQGIRVAMMATHGDGGALRARPMALADAQFDGTLWFFTDVHSPKVDEFARDPRVLLTFADESRRTFVSAAGEAEVVRDAARARELWSEGVRVWFPKGPEDPALALVRVAVEVAEYWDGPSATMVLAYGYLKAVTTGRRPDPGHTGMVRY